MRGSRWSLGWCSGWMRCSWSSLMSAAGSSGISRLLGSRAVDGARGRMGPVVAARDRDSAVEGARVPVDEGRRCAPPRGPDADLLAMILRPLGRVQRYPERGISHPVDLTGHRAVGVAHGGGIGPEIEQPAAYLPSSGVFRAPLEEPIEREAAHQGAVREQEVGGHPQAPTAGWPCRISAKNSP